MTAGRIVLEYGTTTVAVPLDSEPAVVGSLDENTAVAVHVEPAADDVAWRMLIGTEPAETPAGDGLADHSGGSARWRAAPYLESARGLTHVRIESRSGDGAWRARGGMIVDVVPGKLGEVQYRALFDELRALSPALVHDVRGKSGRGGAAFADTIGSAWSRAERALRRMPGTPAPARTPRRAADQRRALALAMVLDPAQRADVRRAAGLLDRITAALERVHDDAVQAAAQIESGRGDVAGRVRGRSVYELVDEPRLGRIERVRDAAHDVLERARAVRATDPFARARPAGGALGAAAAGQGGGAEPALRSTLRLARGAGTGGQYVRATSTLYETWVFLRIARAVAAAAASDVPYDELVASLRQRGLGAGLPRGTVLKLELYDGRRVRIVAEPMIRSPGADTGEDRLFRLTPGALPLMPDLLLTVESAAATRVIIIDAKYARALRPAHWDGVERYFEVRPVASPRTSPEVWIAAPVPTGPDATLPIGAAVPTGWRGGLLPLVPASATPHAWISGTAGPHRFTQDEGAAGSRGRHGAGGRDGADIALRAYVTELLYGAG